MNPTPVMQHINDLTETPLLTLSEEQHLTQTVHHAQHLQEQLSNGTLPPEKHELAKIMIQNGETARQHLINANTRLVISIAKTYTANSLTLSDLIHEGVLGLIRATEDFNPTTGNRFSTYATYWIRQRISAAITETDRAIRYTSSMNRDVRLLNRVTDELLLENQGREPTLEEISLYMGPKWTPEKVEDLMHVLNLTHTSLSLNQPLQRGETHDAQTFEATLENRNQEQPHAISEDNHARDILNSSLRSLTPREQAIMTLMHGLSESPEFDTGELVMIFNLSANTIRNIRRRCLAQLRTAPALQEWQEASPHTPSTEAH